MKMTEMKEMNNAQSCSIMGHDDSDLYKSLKSNQFLPLLHPSSLSGCRVTSCGCVEDQRKQMSVIHGELCVTVAPGDGIKIAWRFYVITPSFLLNVTLNVLELRG